MFGSTTQRIGGCIVLAWICTACGGAMDPTAPSPEMDAGVDAMMMVPMMEGGMAPGRDARVTLPTPPVAARLEIQALDIWAQPLLSSEATLSVTSGDSPIRVDEWPTVSIDLYEAQEFTVSLSAPDHESIELTVRYDGSPGNEAISLTTGGDAVGTGISVSHRETMLETRRIPVHTVHLGLRHQWFSANSRPARRGNRLDLLFDGEIAWEQVATDMLTATDHVHLASWWWESDFELVRDPINHVTSSLEERQTNTAIGIMDSISATKRILVGQFLSQDGLVSWVNNDAALRSRGATPADNFEFMGQANPSRGMFLFQVPSFDFGNILRRAQPELSSRSFDDEFPIESTVPPHDVDLTEWPISIDVVHSSYHQKFSIIDSRVAFVGGMNLMRNDWDTSAHLVYEPRRMAIDASTSRRLEVADRERMTDFTPRKDYMVRIEGPAVQDVNDVFHLRWAYQLSEAATYSENSSDFVVDRSQPEFPDGVQAQITTTLPTPFHEYGIAESWFNAVGQAEEYILIEDQYFRVPMLVDLIVERMTEIPTLQLVIITQAVSPVTDPACEWTHRTTDELRTRFPGRFKLYRLRAFDYVETWGFDETEERFTDINIHSKVLIVDDRFLSVGSCNKNNRGLVYEGEMNIAVLDDAWVRDARRRLLATVLPEGTTISDDVTTWIEQLDNAASWNEVVWDNWAAEGGDISLDGAMLPLSYTPDGFIYPLTFGTAADCWLSVGPDMT